MDRLTPQARSELMSRIRGRDTGPEVAVRSIVHRLGYRFNLHGKFNGTTLWGRPDLVLPRHATVVFVNGCFWHAHGCARARTPKSNLDYWGPKLAGNAFRDRRNARLLRAAGWRVVTVWECHLRRPDAVLERLRRVLAE